MSAAEWGATVFSLIYLYYAIKNKPICFVYGIIGSALWAFVVYQVHLVFDTGLQIFYIGMSAYGIYRWKFGGEHQTELPITSLKRGHHLLLAVATLVTSYLLYLSSQYIEFIDKPFLDALTTTMLVIGTILLVERKLYSWIYLVVADIGYLYIYGSAQLWLLFFVMLVYIVFGILGFLKWKKELVLAAG